MKRFNFDEFLWLIVLILLNVSIAYLTFTGKIDFYIGNKMVKYIYITIGMLSIISIFQLRNVFTPKENSNIKAKLVPIVLTLIIGMVSIYKQDTFKHTELDKDIRENTLSYIDMKSLYEHEFDYDKTKLQNEKKETLIINEDNPMILEDIKKNPENYIGRNLEIHGFVCKGSYLNKNQFIIARSVITCCAADSKIVGIIGEYDRAYDLNENDKIIIKGKIESSTIIDENNINHTIPGIKVENLTFSA